MATKNIMIVGVGGQGTLLTSRILGGLALAGEYQLAGVSIWNIMRYFPQLWLVLNSLYHIEKLG